MVAGSLFIPVIICGISLIQYYSPKEIPAAPENYYDINGGFSSANFGISATLGKKNDSKGQFPNAILFNTPEPGKRFEILGSGHLHFSISDDFIKDVECDITDTSIWPFTNATYRHATLPNGSIQLKAFSPVSNRDPFNSSLPVILVELDINLGEPLLSRFKCMMVLNLSRVIRSPTTCEFQDYTIFHDDNFGMFCNEKTSYTMQDNLLKITMTSLDTNLNKIRFGLVLYHPNLYCANEFSNISRLIKFCINNFEKLKEKTLEFAQILPFTEDPVLNEYLRWYMTAAIQNTKILKSSEVIIMSYVELNMRDSFWASFIHLVYWPKLELKMLEEFAEKQNKTTGEIPTTVLPEIWRHDLDTSMYFILRALRFYLWTKNSSILLELYENLLLAFQYLQSNDVDNDGIPDHPDFWADWKDVYYMDGRKNSPYTSLLWLATIKAMMRINEIISCQNNTILDGLYNSCASKIHSPFNESSPQDGGMWNSMYYSNIWKDSSKYYPYYDKIRIYEDQMISGGVFHEISNDRFPLIISSLNDNNENNFGVRESYPYLPPQMSEGEGEYHNGGIWPFVVFNDALARFYYGFPDSAKRIIYKVCKADLENDLDFLPNEYLAGESGHGKGHTIQAWSSSLFQAIYFGYFGIDLFDPNSTSLNDTECTMLLKAPINSTFKTKILLYSINLTINQTYMQDINRTMLSITINANIHANITFGIRNQYNPCIVTINDEEIIKSRNITLGNCSFDLYNLYI
ncbi:MAG: GH116 family glycosyl hydrolase [Promethearchaeota archaeon]